MHDEPAQTHRGFRDAAGGALRSAADLAKTHADLLLLEADEAKRTSRTLSCFIGVGLVSCSSGYTLLLAAAAHLAATRWLGGNFIIAAAALAAVHLFVGILLLVAARARLRRARFFEETLDQFQHDHQWLSDLQKDLKKHD